MDYRQELLEENINKLTRALDVFLETNYGDSYVLHPNRRVHGFGSNPSFDGLFCTTSSFTLGYGSSFGRGYIIKIDIRTLDPVSLAFKEEIETTAYNFMRDNLKNYLPDRDIRVVKDGTVLKLVGDFSL